MSSISRRKEGPIYEVVFLILSEALFNLFNRERKHQVASTLQVFYQLSFIVKGSYRLWNVSYNDGRETTGVGKAGSLLEAASLIFIDAYNRETDPVAKAKVKDLLQDLNIRCK